MRKKLDERIVKRFALFPTRLGKTRLWLETYYTYEVFRTSPGGEFGAWCILMETTEKEYKKWKKKRKETAR